MPWWPTMYRLTAAVAVTCTTVFASNHLYARDDGRFANSPLKEWFDHLASRNGLCCAFADGVSLQDAGGVPVVFIGVGDPVGSGFVSSFAHPGGNVTGFASHDPSMGGKWLEVLKET